MYCLPIGPMMVGGGGGGGGGNSGGFGMSDPRDPGGYNLPLVGGGAVNMRKELLAIYHFLQMINPLGQCCGTGATIFWPEPL